MDLLKQLQMQGLNIVSYACTHPMQYSIYRNDATGAHTKRCRFNPTQDYSFHSNLLIIFSYAEQARSSNTIFFRLLLLQLVMIHRNVLYMRSSLK